MLYREYAKTDDNIAKYADTFNYLFLFSMVTCPLLVTLPHIFWIIFRVL